MAQIKVFGLRSHLGPLRSQLSDVIHSCMVDALAFPNDKRGHRFFPMDPEDFYYPAGRSDAYTIIEITMITGRSLAARKQLVRNLYERVTTECGIVSNDLEICIYEVPAENWGFRGQHGDEIALNYKIDV
jgi:phenylpyruvate tautomerase PptA (4-oxalocrotonate tautomerase family)